MFCCTHLARGILFEWGGSILSPLPLLISFQGIVCLCVSCQISVALSFAFPSSSSSLLTWTLNVAPPTASLCELNLENLI